jgi:hypothetical protein
MKRIELDTSFLTLLISILVFLPAIAFGEPVQWQIEVGGNGHWYDSVAYNSNWDEAKAHAESQEHNGMQGHLVTITSKEEQDFVWSHFPYNFWLGGYQDDKSSEPQGNWIWVTGEKWVYTNWRDGEPSNSGSSEDCLEFYGGDPNGKWNDFFRTSSNNGYIIEYETKPTAPPSKPTLTLSISGTWLSLSWSSLANADGYTFFYAPYPYEGPQTIGSLDMGTQTSATFNLWVGAAYYVAMEAYNSFGGSGFSNIEYFAITDTGSVTGKIPDTGQTTCYGYYDWSWHEITCPPPEKEYDYGQDANYLINPPSYTKLDSSGNALPASATSWVMVRDNVTGLIWEVKTDDDSIHDRDSEFTWQDAQNVFVATLNSNRFGGYSDWRLPTIKELAYLVDYGDRDKYEPSINRDFFPNTPDRSHWSSTPSPRTKFTNPDNVMTLNFGSGATSIYARPSDYLVVRAVRGRQSPNDFVDNQDGTVTDKTTGLMWQQGAAPYFNYNWREALFYCEKLTLAGYTDWRLPTIKELYSIVDYDTYYYNPLINHLYFPETWSDTYWSSTSYIKNDPKDTWCVTFRFGYISSPNHKLEDRRVRAVRGGQ